MCYRMKQMSSPLFLDITAQELLDLGDDGSLGGALFELRKNNTAYRIVTYIGLHQGARLIHAILPLHNHINHM